MEQEKRVIEIISNLADEVKELKEQISAGPQNEREMTDEVAELFTALAKAQGEFDIAGENSENAWLKNKYANLKQVVMAARPALSKHGLGIVQPPISYSGSNVVLKVYLTHASGQWMMAKLMVRPPKNDIQSFGSTLTYLRRYMIASLCGIVSGDQEDDDGEASVAADGYRPGSSKAPQQQYDYDVITREQLEQLEYELDGYPELAEKVVKGFELRSLADMPKKKFQACLNKIRELKKMYKKDPSLYG